MKELCRCKLIRMSWSRIHSRSRLSVRIQSLWSDWIKCWQKRHRHDVFLPHSVKKIFLHLQQKSRTSHQSFKGGSSFRCRLFLLSAPTTPACLSDKAGLSNRLDSVDLITGKLKCCQCLEEVKAMRCISSVNSEREHQRAQSSSHAEETHELNKQVHSNGLGQ